MTFQNGCVCCCCWNYFFFTLCYQHFFLTKMSSHNTLVTQSLNVIWSTCATVRLIVMFFNSAHCNFVVVVAVTCFCVLTKLLVWQATATNKFLRPAWSCGSSAWHLPVSRRTKTQKNTRQFSLFPLEDEIFYFFLPSEMALNFNQICWFSNANNFFNFQHEIWKWAMHMFKSMNATNLAHEKRLL